MAAESTRPGFSATGHVVGGEWHVTVHGELDHSTRGLLVLACLDGGTRPVVVDLTAVTFMDAAGFGGLVTARAVVATRGSSLSVRNASGEPDRLLSLLEATEPAIGGYWPPRLDTDMRFAGTLGGAVSMEMPMEPSMEHSVEPSMEIPLEPPSEAPFDWTE